MMIESPELGYTPANLRAVREKYGLTQTQVAEIVGVRSYIQVGRWEIETDSPARRADMPLEKWRILLAHIAAK